MQYRNKAKNQILIMAVAAGVNVANLYYAQPILHDIAANLHVTETQAGNLPVLTQAGYGVGLLLLTPLGDKVDRRSLINILQGCLVLTLAASALVTGIGGLYPLSLLIGVFSVGVQVLMPMAALLALGDKGRTVGFVFTGALIGILAARAFSGFVTHWLGWRAVYGLSAAMVLACMAFIHITLPRLRPTYTGNYRSLIASTFGQLRRFALLRRITLLGFLVFGLFCSFWTTLTFHLGGPPFYYGSARIGLLGLLGIGGALLAPYFGRLAERANPAKAELWFLGLILLGILCLMAAPYQILAVGAAVLLLDVGVQATQVSNFAQIYTLDERAQSRINTIYVTFVFLGAATGTWAGVQCWALGGWAFVCLQLLIWCLLAFVLACQGYAFSRGGGKKA